MSHKALYSRNKFRTFGKEFWEKNRCQRYTAVSLTKKNLLRNILKTFVLNKMKRFGVPYRHLKKIKVSNSNHAILGEGENTVVAKDAMPEVFNVYFSNIASEVGFKDEYATPEETISAHCNHPRIVKIRNAYGVNMRSFHFQAVNCDCIARKLTRQIWGIW